MLYGAAIKDILQMASGVKWNEDYENLESDVASSPIQILDLIKYMGNLKKLPHRESISNTTPAKPTWQAQPSEQPLVITWPLISTKRFGNLSEWSLVLTGC